MIPNIVKGKGISGAIIYALGQGNEKDGKTRKVLQAGEQSRADILGGQNFGFDVTNADQLDMARRMMEWNGKAENQASRGRKCENDCLHASLSWEKGQEPTREEMTEAAQEFLKSLGMEKAQAVFIAHNDTEHRHLHIIASRIDPESGKTFSQAEDFYKGQAWAIQYEKQHGQIPENEARRNLHRMVDAIEARDVTALVDNLTQRTPTFTARELDKALSYATLTKDERTEFRGEVLADKNVIGLKETADAKVSRYTTRDVLASEMGLQRSAQNLADDRSHGLTGSRVDQTAAAFTLKPEQAKALTQLTSAEGFGILWGEAGTGKSHVLKAVRSAYDAEGYDVRGLAPSHRVKIQMQGDGFKNANTIASELKAIEDGRCTWNKKTVVVVDEAAMVSTDNLAKLAAAAYKAGAKLIIAGDDAQLGSIERGGMFETLRQTHGAAILREVQRIDDLEERKLWGKMHGGDFRDMLAKQDAAGNIHWSEKQTDALRDTAQAYTAATAATPDKSRFMFAVTNAEVGALNAHARDVHKGRGELGEDVTLKTAHGEATFATGDRIQFAGNGYGKKAINAGLSNGNVGTIKEIVFEGDKPRMTVTLDTEKGKAPHEISFVVGSNGKAGEFDNFKLGYAGTIYRGQGNTLDQAFVCHSSQWRGSAAYVALTRHREDVQIFAAHETVKDIEAMAQGFARPENKRAATAYEIDAATVLSIGEMLDNAKNVNASRTTDPLMTSGTQPEAATTRQLDENGQAAEPDSETATTTAAVAEAALEAIGDVAGKAIETLASALESLLGGGSPSPPKTQPRPMTAAERQEARLSALAKSERIQQEQRTARLEKIRREIGGDISDEQTEEAARTRDRGGGISR